MATDARIDKSGQSVASIHRDTEMRCKKVRKGREINDVREY